MNPLINWELAETVPHDRQQEENRITSVLEMF